MCVCVRERERERERKKEREQNTRRLCQTRLTESPGTVFLKSLTRFVGMGKFEAAQLLQDF